MNKYNDITYKSTQPKLGKECVCPTDRQNNERKEYRTDNMRLMAMADDLVN
ncbi:hypothetical protein P1X15_14025 [Runella sp. MFBS21]|uniref:hypothetical protein n=1 Tax=Runella sp. MFBS21 TaxID=3034018 RepID=UPI0023F9780E|nr:hypothetical protein [Runella sp. MFBS21]MDF7818728.1 hypothetical protein [Runella sp. MFBS21]